MKKKKRGFTLVELLAVIVILAVILVIAVPRIMSVIKDAKLGSIESTAKLIASTAESRYESKKALGLDVGDLKCTDVASLSNDYGKCKITFDDNGVATVIVNGKKDGKFDNLACQGTRNNITCIQGEIPTSRMCKYYRKLTDGLEFVDGQYTYRYSTSSDGWSVVLTNKTSTDPVTTELCGTINDKPIVSMNGMFQNSKATSIDLSSFDTSKVTNMAGMFSFSNATSLNLNSFDTSNVTNMSSMFSNSATMEIKGLENFDTSKVTDMSDMFRSSKLTNLDLSNFDTSNVTDMNEMFRGSAATTLDLSSFDTSNVTSMYGMFESSAATSLDLSSFDTSNVTNMSWMFQGSKATTGYARTEQDANRFNASGYKPSGLTFVVKS
ncbi:MAG: BspA family leucine-rich repeat surface protein [Bacilli bacterium]